jgi:hypothetical protein
MRSAFSVLRTRWLDGFYYDAVKVEGSNLCDLWRTRHTLLA